MWISVGDRNRSPHPLPGVDMHWGSIRVLQLHFFAVVPGCACVNIFKKYVTPSIYMRTLDCIGGFYVRPGMSIDGIKGFYVPCICKSVWDIDVGVPIFRQMWRYYASL